MYITGQLFLIAVWALSGGGHPWFAFSLFGWGIFLAAHGVYSFVMKTPEEIMIERAAREEQRSSRLDQIEPLPESRH